MLGELVDVFGEGRQAAVCRELTKRFEEVRRGTLAELASGIAGKEVKGEVVVLIDRPGTRVADGEALDAALSKAMSELSVSAAAAEVAAQLGLPRRQVYQRALELAAEE